MVDRNKQQELIDSIFQQAKRDREDHIRLCEVAKRGVDAPGSLSPDDVRQVCYALVVHYAQMGIG